MLQEIPNLNDLDHYLKPNVIRHLIEKLCSQVMEDFHEFPEKTQIVGVSFIANVPVIDCPREKNMILFFRAERSDPHSALCQVDIETLYLTETIPDALLDLYNSQKHKNISLSDLKN